MDPLLVFWSSIKFFLLAPILRYYVWVTKTSYTFDGFFADHFTVVFESHVPGDSS